MEVSSPERETTFVLKRNETAFLIEFLTTQLKHLQGAVRKGTLVHPLLTGFSNEEMFLKLEGLIYQLRLGMVRGYIEGGKKSDEEKAIL